jgi:hypothetical protein
MANARDFNFVMSIEDEDFNSYDNGNLSLETQLDLEHMLRVDDNAQHDVNTRALMSASWAYEQFSKTEEADLVEWYVNAAYACIKYDLVSSFDGQSLRMNVCPLTDANKSQIESIIDPYKTNVMLNCILVSKIYWWLTGHHPTADNFEGIVLKFVNNYLHMLEKNEVSKLVCAVARWASTCKVYTSIGINDIVVPPNYVLSSEAQVHTPFIDELTVRMRFLPPAGCHRYYIVYEILNKMIHNFVFRYTNLWVESKPLLDQNQIIRTNPAFFHLKSKYLTGKCRPADFSDKDAEALLGRLSTFLVVFFPNCVLLKSPYITRPSNEFLYCKYADYDSAFYRLCVDIKVNKLDMETVDKIRNFEMPDETCLKISEFSKTYFDFVSRFCVNEEDEPHDEAKTADSKNKLYGVYDFLFDNI